MEDCGLGGCYRSQRAGNQSPRTHSRPFLEGSGIEALSLPTPALSVTQHSRWGPRTSSPPGGLLEMQNLRPHPDSLQVSNHREGSALM